MLGFFACHFLRISTRVKISQNEDTKELKKDKLSVGNYIRVGVLLSSLCEIFLPASLVLVPYCEGEEEKSRKARIEAPLP